MYKGTDFLRDNQINRYFICLISNQITPYSSMYFIAVTLFTDASVSNLKSDHLI